MKASLARGHSNDSGGSKKPKKLVYESKHPYDNSTDEYVEVKVKGAKKLIIEFDEQSKTESCDWVKFYKDDSHTETWHPTPEYFSGGKDGSSSNWPGNWPGFGGRPPLEIEADSFVYYFHSDYSVNDWGWLFTVTPVMGGEGCGLPDTPSEATLTLSALQNLLFEHPAPKLPPTSADLEGFQTWGADDLKETELPFNFDMGAEESKGEETDFDDSAIWVDTSKETKSEFQYEKKKDSSSKLPSLVKINDEKEAAGDEDNEGLFDFTDMQAQGGQTQRLMNAFRDNTQNAVKLYAQQCISIFLSQWPKSMPFQVSSIGSVPQLLSLLKTFSNSITQPFEDNV